jgi:hypothetical protein
MADLSDITQVKNVKPDLYDIAIIFNKAISNQNQVELRVEDLPRMNMDSTLKTTLSGVIINEKDKVLYIDAAGLSLMYQYEKYSSGSSSSTHRKFYFQSEGASLTVVVSL